MNPDRMRVWHPKHAGRPLANPYIRALIPDYVEHLAIADSKKVSTTQAAQARYVAALTENALETLIDAHNQVHGLDHEPSTVISEMAGHYVKNSKSDRAHWNESTRRILSRGPLISGAPRIRIKTVRELIDEVLEPELRELADLIHQEDIEDEYRIKQARYLEPGDELNLQFDLIADREGDNVLYGLETVTVAKVASGDALFSVRVTFTHDEVVVFPGEHRVRLAKTGGKK